MNNYQRAKEIARNKAIKWQSDLENHNYSYEELANWQDYFWKIGMRYGLVHEFIENGII